MAGVQPNSARSTGRDAWKDTDQLYDNDPETARDAPTPFGEFGDQPTAMESEVFDKHGAVRVQQRHGKSDEPQGCWYQFKKGLRSIWMTRQTEDTKRDREMYIRTTLRELIIYIIFLIVLCIVTFGMISSTMYYYTKVMSELFLDSTGDKHFIKTYRGITRIDDFWKYTESNGPLMKGLYWEKWYDNRNVSQEEKGFIFYENKLLGLPRIRMLKVKEDSCDVPDAFEREIKQCYDSYSSDDEDREPKKVVNATDETAWKYHSEDYLGSTGYWGVVSTYGGGGYYVDLRPTKAEAELQIADLKKNGWIERGTRDGPLAILHNLCWLAIAYFMIMCFLDFSVYNANINLFCIVKLILEFPATGGVIPSQSFRTVKLIRYVTAFDIFVLVCEGIFCAFIVYYIIEEIIEIIKHRLSYFKSFWNILDIIVILLAICCIAFSIYRTLVVDDKLEELLNSKDQYANFEFLSFAQTRFNDALAVMIFIAWIKIFKYISFNKTMNQLSSTLSRCAKDVGGFAIMFFIFFFAYAQLGYLIFGTQVRDFSTFYDAVFTLLRTILGDFDFHELEQANRVLGPIFFITYVFFVFFVLLNMFLAIINDTYAEVKAELATQKSEFELGDYFKRAYYSMLRKMNMKKADKIVDIQAALHGADMDADKQVDFEEWRQHLKVRGYSEQEIQNTFAKYDLDGDRVLSEEEQRRMQEDLETQKHALDAERYDLQASGGGEGSQTARRSLGDTEPGLGGPVARGGRTRGTVFAEEFNVLHRRVGRMENSVSSVVSKIDAVLMKMEGMERVKMRHREKMANLIESAIKGGGSDQDKLKGMTEGIKSELDRFEKDSETDPL